jgi:hypothetical protein
MFAPQGFKIIDCQLQKRISPIATGIVDDQLQWPELFRSRSESDGIAFNGTITDHRLCGTPCSANLGCNLLYFFRGPSCHYDMQALPRKPSGQCGAQTATRADSNNESTFNLSH